MKNFLPAIIFFFLFYSSINALESTFVFESALTHPQVDTTYVPTEMLKRLKIKFKNNDSTILIYAFKADIRDIVKEINRQSKKYRFLMDTTISGISPEIAIQKEKFDIGIDLLLKMNNLHREKVNINKPSQFTAFRIKRGQIKKERNVYSENETSLEKKLNNFSNKEVFQRTVFELESKGKESVPVLARILNKNEDKTLRKIIVTILGKIECVESLHLLIRNLDEEPLLEIKMIIIESLLKVGKNNKQDLSLKLFEIYNGTKDDNTRLAAMIGFLKLSNDKNQNIKILKNEVKNPNLLIKLKASEYLAKLGDKSVLNIALENVYNENPILRGVALDILAELGDKRGIPVAKELMSDSDSNVRIKARLALRKIEYADTVLHSEDNPPKISHLRYIFVNDVEKEVKYWAAEVLLNLGQSGEEALKEIANKNEYGETRIIAIKVLNSKK